LRNFYGLKKEDGVLGSPVTEEGVVGIGKGDPLDIGKSYHLIRLGFAWV